MSDNTAAIKAALSANNTAAKALIEPLRTDKSNFKIAKTVHAAMLKGGDYRGMAVKASLLLAEIAYPGKDSEFHAIVADRLSTKGGTKVSHVTLYNAATAWSYVLTCKVENSIETTDKGLQLMRRATADQRTTLANKCKAIEDSAKRTAYFLTTAAELQYGNDPFAITTDTRVETPEVKTPEVEETTPATGVNPVITPSADVVVATIQGWGNANFSDADNNRILAAIAAFLVPVAATVAA